MLLFPLEFHPEKKKEREEEDSPGKALNLCHGQGLIHTTKNSFPQHLFFLSLFGSREFPAKDPALSFSVKPQPSLVPIRTVSSAFVSSKVFVIKAQAILSPHHNELLVLLGMESVCYSLD